MSSHLNPFHRYSTAAASAVTDTTASKRKLDDCYAFSDSPFSDVSSDNSYSSSRMRKDYLFPSSPPPCSFPARHLSTSDDSSASPPSRLQLFVRMLPVSNTLVIHADPSDSIKSVHERINSLTRLPIDEQRLIYRGRQLDCDLSLKECRVENDANLHLVGRLRSTSYPQAWKAVDDMVSQIFDLYRGFVPRSGPHTIKSRLEEFIKSTPDQNLEQSAEHLQIFLSASAPAALVMLYMSPIKSRKSYAEESIRYFLDTCKATLHKSLHKHCAVIVFELCQLLRSAVGVDNPLYSLCRSCLASMIDSAEIGDECSVSRGSLVFREIFLFLSELARELSELLISPLGSDSLELRLSSNISDFVLYLAVIRKAVAVELVHRCFTKYPFCIDDNGCTVGGGEDDKLQYKDEIKCLHGIFINLLEKTDICLNNMEDHLGQNMNGGSSGHLLLGRWQHLAILKMLYNMSRLYVGAEERFWSCMEKRKTAMCYLIIHFAKRIEDHRWILEHKEVTNFEARRHLASMFLPEVKDDYEELHEMLIDRSQLLAESFEYIAHVEASSLQGGLFMEFKNEEATGPGVLREWFCLVSQAIFNPQNALFVTCPNDLRRFLPNPASKVDPLHLEYFKFTGRVIALALMHKVQVGIMLDRTFFSLLAGEDVSLEDIRDADPYMYRSCKEILEMDPEVVDEDVLGLTFVQEVEELGSVKAVEICHNGGNVVVNSRNRKQYVNLLVQQRFVLSIAEQVRCFSEGFGDIVGGLSVQRSFFQSLNVGDLDWMLYGNGSAISVEDWKAHTDYNGYKVTDPQISWFWKIVKHMSAERKSILLSFWTSIKHLPVEGFGGLASRLYIYNTGERRNRLPTSHTCFYRLCLPPYKTISAMEDRLNIVTQEHVGYSFGTW